MRVLAVCIARQRRLYAWLAAFLLCFGLTVVCGPVTAMAAEEATAEVAADDAENDVTEGGLYLTMNSGIAGYISEEQREADIAEATAAAEAEAAEAAAAKARQLQYADYMITTLTNNDFLYIRSEASTDGEVLGKLYAGGTGWVIETVDGWTRIESGSVNGWVNNEFILTGVEARDLAEQTGTWYVTVETDGLLVREGTSTDAAIEGAVYTGERYEVLEQHDGWVYIESTDEDGNPVDGYISTEYVSMDLETGSAISKEEEEELLRIEAERKAAEEAAAAEAARIAAEEAAAAAAAEAASAQSYSSNATYANDDEFYTLACMLQVECGTSYEGMVAVANCILNRVNSPLFPNTILGVIYEPGQFATGSMFQTFMAQGPSASAVQAATDALNGYNNLGGYLFFRSAWSANTAAYSSWVNIGGNVFYSK